MHDTHHHSPMMLTGQRRMKKKANCALDLGLMVQNLLREEEEEECYNPEELVVSAGLQLGFSFSSSEQRPLVPDLHPDNPCGLTSPRALQLEGAPTSSPLLGVRAPPPPPPPSLETCSITPADLLLLLFLL